MPICPACRGQKKIQGMGSMGETDCKTCKGTGLEPVAVEILTEIIKAPDAKVGIVQSIKIIEPTKTWSDDALTMKGGDIGKAEALEHIVETHEAALANLGKPSNCFEPEVSKSSETMSERLKRKYTKSTK